MEHHASSFFKWYSCQAKLSPWAQPLTGWKTFLKAMKQTLSGSQKWLLCLKEEKSSRRKITHLWSFPQQDILLVPIFFSYYLFNVSEINMEIAYHLEGRALCCWDKILQRYCRRIRSCNVFLGKETPSCTCNIQSFCENSPLSKKDQRSPLMTCGSQPRKYATKPTKHLSPIHQKESHLPQANILKYHVHC